MQFNTSSVCSLRIAAVATLMAMGTALGCDVSDDDLSADELAFIEADLEEERIRELTVAPEEGEGYVGADDRIDSITTSPMAFGFVNWHSDETAGQSVCPSNQVVTGFDCAGSFCDNVRLECHNYGGTVSSGGVWSAWFEHNGKVSHACPSGQKITGIDCWGDNCDNISIRCSTATGLGTNRCAWTSPWYSDEDPSAFLANVGDAIQGIWCSGTHCDNKRFFVCEI